MTNNCNVARDLMPLVIDGVASEESQKVVVDHVWKCEKCAAIYKDMQAEMQPGKLDESDYLDAAARKLRRKQKNRKRILIAVTCVVTVILVLAGMWGYDYATNRSIFPVALDEYDAYLTRMRNGEVLLNIDMKDELLVCGLSGYSTTGTNGGYVWNVEVNTTLIREYFDEPSLALRVNRTGWNWVDGAMYHISPDKGAPIEAYIMFDGENERILYQVSDDIPLCSEELEAYYAAWDAYHDYDNSVNRRQPDFDEQRDVLRQKAIEFGKTVPEFQ